MSMVVHCKKAPYDVYIGRANGSLPQSKWANPWVIGKDGSREEVIQRYEEWIRGQPTLMAALPELENKVLGCWCKGTDGERDVNCHGDVLVRLLGEVSKKDDILPIFSTHYCFNGSSILTLEEAGKTEPGNPTSIVDLARQNHLKQVTVVDDRIDGFIEAFKNLSKPFKPTAPKPLEDYIRDEQGDKKKPSDEDRTNAQKSLDKATLKYEAEKTWSTDPIQLNYGIKICVCADMTIKDEASLRTESKVIIFVKNTQGYSDLIKLYNRAWTDGFYYQGRLDWKTLKEFWTPNLMLVLPFFSSFLAKNLLTFSSIVPDLPCDPKQVWCFKEVGSNLPFAPLIEDVVNAFVKDSGAQSQGVKSVYYKDASSFPAYQTFRAIHEHGTYSAPNVSHLASNTFSWEAFRGLTT